MAHVDVTLLFVWVGPEDVSPKHPQLRIGVKKLNASTQKARSQLSVKQNKGQVSSFEGSSIYAIMTNKQGLFNLIPLLCNQY